ncbi:MAG: TerC family protein [Gemmatimonadota bacterium]|nr:TerC family protein [Gemmatimonadota bacterium]MDH5759330.1 TerC family protein [Gemmatimonadota bacterium]
MHVFVWVGFVALIVGLLALDLGVFHRDDHVPTLAEALGWSGLWISLALAFAGVVYFLYENNWIGVGLAFPEDVSGAEASMAYLTGYILEKSLSLDNIFVIALIFSYFRVPLAHQHRVLFWGVLGALVMRGAMIGAGTLLIERFEWMTYVFGGLLLATAIRMLIAHHETMDPERSPVIRIARRFLPVTDGLRGERFIVVEDGRKMVTPLLLVLLLVESTDLLFAADSIPAILAITSDPFLVFTSNVFAILGLRSLYFALAPLLSRLRFLKASLVFILAFVGVKMLLAHTDPIPMRFSLAVILGILGVGIVASVAYPIPPERRPAPVEEELRELRVFTAAGAKRAAILALGGSFLVLAAFWFARPGPGLLAGAVGLCLVGSQIVWARRLMRRVMGERERHE